MKFWSLLLVLGLFGCSGKVDVADESDADTDTDSDADSDADSDSDSDTDSDTEVETTTFNLELTGTGYDANESFVVVVAATDGSWFGHDVAVVGADGAINQTYDGVLESGKTYRVSWQIGERHDVCLPSVVSAVSWQQTTVAVTGDVTITGNASATTTDICTDFDSAIADVTFTGGGYTPHVGNDIDLLMLDEDGVTTSRRTISTVAEGGEISFVFPNVLFNSGDYAVLFYADLEDNDECDALDHMWKVPFTYTGDEKDMTVDYDHKADFTDICSYFPGGIPD